jgi:hypothetical protein
MVATDTIPHESFLKEDSFGFIKSEDFEALGIDASDIPPGTFPARKHPSRLLSRFGGNAYGFGFFEAYDRLSPRDQRLLQSIPPGKPEYAGPSYKEINRIYETMGLLIRFSRLGKPYYLIPVHYVSRSLSTIRNKADEITGVIQAHSKKTLKESLRIGLLTHLDDLLIPELSLRLKEHQFLVLDSFATLTSLQGPLDLVILPRELHEFALAERLSAEARRPISKRQLENYAYYIMGKVFGLLTRDGEIFIIAGRLPVEPHREIKVKFRSEEEAKNFVLFSHVFKTERRYQAKAKSFAVRVFEFHKFLNLPYVETEVLDRLLGHRRVEDMTLREINRLPYLDFPLDAGLSYNQEKVWTQILTAFFNEIILKSLVPDSVKEEWSKRFSTGRYTPDYMLTYLGQKKSLPVTLEELKREVAESRLAGCPLPLLADYRDSFDYVLFTLQVLKKIKTMSYQAVPELFMERLREPLESKRRRYGALNHVLRLMSKLQHLERVKAFVNPEGIEGSRTSILNHLEALSLFGFSPGELKEVFLIVLGHSALGRILSGKMNENALKPVSDLARTLDPQEALNLLRYCRLMSMAETVASRRTDLQQEELNELFDLYESMVKVVTNREVGWDLLLDDKIIAVGGIRPMAIRKMLKMMSQFPFLNHWSELTEKGEMEKETLADYDPEKLSGIEKVITLIETVDRFERAYFREDPLKASEFYRKLLQMEFHGTGRVFERIDSELVFLLLWITVHVVKGGVVNFNPILADVEPSETESQFGKLNEEVPAINVKYLDLNALKGFSEQLYADQTSFIVGTGFQFRVNPRTQAVDVTYIDMDQNIESLESLSERIAGRPLPEIPLQDLDALERVFGNLEGFFQSHLKLISHDGTELRLPERQRAWFRKAQNLRSFLRSSFIRVVFQPENLFSNLDLLYHHTPSLLRFVLPELMELESLNLPEQVPLTSTVKEHIFVSTRKMQALIRKDRAHLQDIPLLHKLAQREFGPLAAGIVGLNDFQVETLEKMVTRLEENPPLLEALVLSLVFRDLGLLPELREKYRGEYHPADHAKAGAYFVEKEKFGLRYGRDEKVQGCLTILVRYHNLLHHMIRGEFSFHAAREVVDFKDKDLLDAIFLGSFMMMFAMEEAMIIEDLATSLFQLRNLCRRVIDGETNPEHHLREIYFQKGRDYYAVEAYRRRGLPEGMSPSRYLESYDGEEPDQEAYVRSGAMIYAMERILRLRGIRHVEFHDLANVMVKVPMKFIYKKRSFSSIGYASFEKELFEALRIHNGLHRLPEEARHFVLERLVADEVRIYGFESVSAFLNYENMIKLLLISLMAAKRFRPKGKPISLDFLALAWKIEKRYEAVNDALSQTPVEKIWGSPHGVQHFFKAKEGIVLAEDEKERVLFVDFIDSINISEKIVHLMAVTNLEELKSYFHSKLRFLRKVPFYTEDYEIELEKAFETRRLQLTDLMVDQVKRQMAQQKDFRNLHEIFQDVMERALEIGFTDDQKHRLMDLLELRKDQVRREKLEETTRALTKIQDIQELRDYWDEVKGYLIRNRPYLGAEFGNLIAKRFDETMVTLEERDERTRGTVQPFSESGKEEQEEEEEQ